MPSSDASLSGDVCWASVRTSLGRNSSDRNDLFGKREATIIGTLEEVGGHLRYVEETKTPASRRSVSIPGFLVDVLASHLGRVDGEFVFVSQQGALLRRSNFRRGHFKPALQRAGLDPAVRFHDLRHTCAALMIEQGAHPKEIQARLGQADIRTTLHRYGHLMPTLGAHLDKALDKARAEALANLSRPARGLEVVGLDGAREANRS